MNIEKIAREALSVIKKQWGLPTSGFLAGGAIANIMWEIVSGNKAVVNDVDIFIFGGLVDKTEQDKFNYQTKNIAFFEDYVGRLGMSIENGEFYTIIKAEKDGIFNLIYYKSNKDTYSIIINSFDINATKIGYSIEDDKFYWSKDFEDFLSSGELKISCITTPAHTAIRLAKKEKELNAKLNNFEFKIIQHCLNSNKFCDTIKLRFKDKYLDLYNEYSNRLDCFFSLHRDLEVEQYVLETKSIITGGLYTLNSKNKEVFIDDVNLGMLYTSVEFIFYIRNIHGNEELKKIWTELYWFFDRKDYIDIDVNIDDVKLLSRLGKYAPNSIKNLKGLKISEQLMIVKKFLNKYIEDPIVAISIFERLKIDKNIDLDDGIALLLELSVRKDIVDPKNEIKVSKILNGESDEIINYLPIL
jgi:hypothetical protein